MKKLFLFLILISQLIFSQQIDVNKNVLQIFDSDTLLIFNSGEPDLILDTLYSVNPAYGYRVEIQIKDSVINYYSVSQVIDPTSLDVTLSKNDTAKFIFGSVDLCIFCKSSGIVEYFSDTLMLISNSINNDSLFLHVEGNGFLSDAEEENFINSYSLSQNYPNPFNPATKIKYSIDNTGHVTLKVFDMLGKEIATLVNEEKPAGTYEINFDGSSADGEPELSSGIYFYRINTGNFTQTKKMLLLR